MNMTPERLTELHDWVFAADEDDIVQRIESAEAEVDRLRAQVAGACVIGYRLGRSDGQAEVLYTKPRPPHVNPYDPDLPWSADVELPPSLRAS